MNTTTTTWADLDTANKADRHYINRYPEFLLLAREAESQACIERNRAINAWLDCTDNTVMDNYRKAIIAADERWCDCRAAANVLYGHWMRLIRDAAQECTCNPGQVVICPACLAERRLADPHYEPNVTELLKEG